MKVQPFFVLLGYLGDLENKVQSEEHCTTVTTNVHCFYSTGWSVGHGSFYQCPKLGWQKLRDRGSSMKAETVNAGQGYIRVAHSGSGMLQAMHGSKNFVVIEGFWMCTKTSWVASGKVMA
jgi:hypothetical protein